MKIQAAILWEQGAALSVEEAELEAPRAGEILVEVKAAGVCHSDLHPARGDWPARTPLVLGHEGAGIVREVGEGVLPFHRFAALVKDQVTKLRDSGNPEVAFRVAMKDGKVTFTARGLSGSRE